MIYYYHYKQSQAILQAKKIPLKLLHQNILRNYSSDKKNKLLILLIILIDQRRKMRKISNINPQIPLLFATPKTTSYSLSTQESPRQHQYPISSHKEKSQLCKKFVENGYCPYEKKCKFAHGLHELKKNQQANSKYKTKICGGFLQEGFCPYGNRCNFIHPSSTTSAPIRNIDIEFVNIKMESIKQSRLLKLLEN